MTKPAKLAARTARQMCRALLSALLVLAVIAGGLVTDLRPAASAEGLIAPIRPVEAYEEEPTPTPEPLKGGSLQLIYSPEASLNLTTGEITMYYKNPNASQYEVTVMLYIVTTDEEGNEIEIPIAESEPVEPGKIRTYMELSIDKELLFPGRYDARFHLKLIEIETGEEIPFPTVLDGISLSARKKQGG